MKQNKWCAIPDKDTNTADGENIKMLVAALQNEKEIKNRYRNEMTLEEALELNEFED